MKQTIKNIIAIALALGMFAGAVMGQTLIHSESFETAPGSTYTLSAVFDDAGFDYFGQYAVPDNLNAARDDFQTGWDGSFGIQGQDHDGDGENATQSVFITGIDISSAPAVSLTISFGGLNSEPNFSNYEAVDGDGIEIYSNIDGGGLTLIGAFKPPVAGSGDLYLDTNLDGTGDGANLTVDLADFSFNLGGTGNALDLEIRLTSTDSFEPVALDNIRVYSVPEPASAMFLGSLAGLFALVIHIRRRKL